MPKINRKLGVLFLSLTLSLVPLLGRAKAEGMGEKGLVPRLALSPAVVGRPTRIRWDLSEGKPGEPVSHRLTLMITHLEKGKTIFSLNQIPVERDLVFGFHFTDATEYRISAVAELKSGEVIEEERVIGVTGLEPPWGTFFPPLVLFLAVIALGLVTGRISCRSKTKKSGEG